MSHVLRSICRRILTHKHSIRLCHKNTHRDSWHLTCRLCQGLVCLRIYPRCTIDRMGNQNPSGIPAFLVFQRICCCHKQSLTGNRHSSDIPAFQRICCPRKQSLSDKLPAQTTRRVATFRKRQVGVTTTQTTTTFITSRISTAMRSRDQVS